jgi:nicotinamidase-related amidase
MKKRILDIVDMQVDFMRADGKLAVPGADALIARANDFFRALPQGAFDFALFKYDTHFADEYPRSPESQSFPNIHCEYGTEGWSLAVDDAALRGKMPLHYMTKNTFNMWENNPLSDAAQLKFANDTERKAYANLYRVTGDRLAVTPGTLRDAFMKAIGPGDEVTVIGVASDFCIHDAILGYLERGATVNVVEDLVTGIGTSVPGRAASGHIRDVLKLPPFARYVVQGRVRLVTARDVLSP